MLKKLDMAVSAGMLLIQLAHVASVFYFFQPLVIESAVGTAREPSLWWVAGGVGFWFVGALNLLRIHYAPIVPVLNAVCSLFNGVLLIYVVGLLINSPRFLLLARIPLLVCIILALAFSVSALRKNRLIAGES